jgi:hypothetical protein
MPKVVLASNAFEGLEAKAPGRRPAFAARPRGQAGLNRAFDFQSREPCVNPLQIVVELATARPPQKATSAEIVFDGEMGEDMPSLQHMDDAATGKNIGRDPGDRFDLEADCTAADAGTIGLHGVRTQNRPLPLHVALCRTYGVIIRCSWQKYC